MMKKRLLILLSFSILSVAGYGQLASPSVSGGNNGQAGSCDGTANAFITYTAGNATTDYNVAEIPYNPPYSFDPVAGSTLIPLPPPNQNQDDFWANQLFTLPFSFSFYGTNYNQVSIGSNGVICFNTTGVYAPGQYCPWPIAAGGLPNATPIRNAIFGVLQDINFTTLPYPETSINYYVYDQGENAAPGRVFILNVNKVLQFGDGTNPDTNVAGVQSYQIILYETTNIIDVYVKKRVPYNPWNSGRGIIGIINNAGTQWEAAPNSNGTNFTAIGKAYRFSPAGPPTATVQWYHEGVPVNNTGANPAVIAVPGAAVGDELTAVVTYHNGNVSSDFSAVMVVGDGLSIDEVPNGGLKDIVCPDESGPHIFDINQDDTFLAGTNPSNYEIYYYTDPQDAEDNANNYIVDTHNYPIDPADLPVTIYARITDIASGTPCHVVKSFFVDQIVPVGNISYDPVVCKDSQGSVNVTMSPDLMLDGEFIASSPDLVVNSVTGTIDLTTSLPGTYTVDYYPVPVDCPNLKMSAPVTIVGTPTAAFDAPADYSVCYGTGSNLSITGTADAILTYSRTDTNGTVVATTPILANGTALINDVLVEDTTYELQKISSNTTPSCEYIFPPGTTREVSVGATAEITGSDAPSVCFNSGSTLIHIFGTLGGTVNYTKGTSETGSVILDSVSGEGIIDTQNLSVDTTFTLTDIIAPGCAQPEPITGESITITINPLPDVTSFTAVTATVCEGTDATFNFTGTANATVNFHDGNNNPFNYVIPASGNGQILLPAGTYTLDNITSTDLCINPLTQSITVGVDLEPVIITQPVAPATICEQDTFSVTVQATGTDLTYEWKHGAVTVQNGPSNTYTKNNAILADAGDYSVIVHGKCSPDAISVTVQATITEGPHFATHPVAPIDNCIGDDITLTVSTTSTDASTNFDWRRNGISVGAPSSNTLQIFGVTLADDGSSYTVVVTNPGCPSITSNATVLHVKPDTAITTQPVASIDQCALTSFTLSVAAEGGDLSYEWRRNAQIVQSGPSNTYVVNSADATNNTGSYEVTVIGRCGAPVTSTITNVTIVEPPVITTQPVAPNEPLCGGQSLNLSVQTSGTVTQYQWQRDGVNVGTNSPNYSVSSTVEDDEGSYRCIVSNPTCGSVQSDTVEVIINDPTVITLQPVSQTVCVGETINLLVEVQAPEAITYRWQKDGVDVGNQALLQITPADLDDSGVYRCFISSGTCPDVVSQPATVIVRPLPDATIANGAESTICANTGTDVIFTGTPNSIVTYTVNGGEEQTITLNPSGSARLLTGVLAETTTYNLVSVAANDNPPCPKVLDGQAVVTVRAIPDPELDQDGYICLDPVLGQTMPGSFYELNTGLSTADGYTFIWYLNDVEITGATEGTYNAVEQGNYEVGITDTLTGCTDSATAPIVTSTPPLTITADVVTGYFEENATVVVTATPAGDFYEYRLDDGPWQTDNVFTGLRTVLSINNSGDHTVYVRDTKACDELSYDVKVIDYPKYFTPNGDGYHDTWNIPALSNQPGAKIFIFDRFGKLLKQISTTNPTGWDGTYNGQPMTADDYWFVVKYAEQGINKEFKAHFAIKR
jgi:gliding motility-associated-like protein